MAIKNCYECGREISDKAVICPGCGAPIAKPEKPEYTSESTISPDSNSKSTARIAAGIALQIIGLIVWFTFNGKYINGGTEFGGNYNTYSYQTLVYIATALRWGLSGILFGLGAILEFDSTPPILTAHTRTVKYRPN